MDALGCHDRDFCFGCAGKTFDGTVKLRGRRAPKSCAVPASFQIAAAILEISRQTAKARSRDPSRISRVKRPPLWRPVERTRATADLCR
jgi:hypothetical protein